MNNKQAIKYNQMLGALKTIANSYQTTNQLRKSSKGKFGLDYEEALEMAYENIQNVAKMAIRGLQRIDTMDSQPSVKK